MKHSRLDLVIFDCDGVLIDSEPIASRTLAEAITRAGVPMSAAEAHVLFTGKSEAQLAAWLDEQGVPTDATFFATWHEAIYEAFRKELRAMAGIESVLEALDVPKCVASNSSMARLEKSLGILDVLHPFAPHIFSADMVARPKPAPDLVLHCLKAFGARPERSIMVDDSTHGILAAKAAGVRPIGFVDPRDPRPDRREILIAAGAFSVAVGAGELAAQLSLDLPAQR